MYSLVLAAALSGQATVPAHCWRGCHCWCGCHCYCGCSCWCGCWGCHHYCGCWCGCYSCACYGCYGCYVCHGCYACYGCCGGVVVQSAYVVQPASNGGAQQLSPPKPAGTEGSPQAKVIIEAPANAKVYVDDKLTNSSGKTQRVFVTPRLEQGKDYYYMVKVEMEHEGQTVTETKKLIVRAGKESRLSFAAPTSTATATASK